MFCQIQQFIAWTTYEISFSRHAPRKTIHLHLCLSIASIEGKMSSYFSNNFLTISSLGIVYTVGVVQGKCFQVVLAKYYKCKVIRMTLMPSGRVEPLSQVLSSIHNVLNSPIRDRPSILPCICYFVCSTRYIDTANAKQSMSTWRNQIVRSQPTSRIYYR